MSVLYVGFKGKHNTSCQLVSALNGEILLLTNSFQGIRRDLSALSRSYDSVILFGADKALTDTICIERCAQCDDQTIFSSFDVERLRRECCDYLISSRISSSPSGYLCNEAYWYLLQKQPNSVLIHIPSIGQMKPEFMMRLVDLYSSIENSPIVFP